MLLAAAVWIATAPDVGTLALSRGTAGAVRAAGRAARQQVRSDLGRDREGAAPSWLSRTRPGRALARTGRLLAGLGRAARLVGRAVAAGTSAAPAGWSAGIDRALVRRAERGHPLLASLPLLRRSSGNRGARPDHESQPKPIADDDRPDGSPALPLPTSADGPDDEQAGPQHEPSVEPVRPGPQDATGDEDRDDGQDADGRNRRLAADGPTGLQRWLEMVCPECGEDVIPLPPTFWPRANGSVPGWSHLGGEPLCPVMTPAGYRPADPAPGPTRAANPLYPSAPAEATSTTDSEKETTDMPTTTNTPRSGEFAAGDVKPISRGELETVDDLDVEAGDAASVAEVGAAYLSALQDWASALSDRYAAAPFGTAGLSRAVGEVLEAIPHPAAMTSVEDALTGLRYEISQLEGLSEAVETLEAEGAVSAYRRH